MSIKPNQYGLKPWHDSKGRIRLVITPNNALPAFAAFFTKLNKLDNGCWKWTGQISRNGYGQIHWYVSSDINVKLAAHRFSYVLHNGPLDPGLEVV